MERLTEPQKNVIFDQNEEPIVLSKHLLDIIYSNKNPEDLLGLYVFYYKTAKFQKTNQIWAITSFTAKGIGWGEDKVRMVKAELKKLKLIEDIQEKKENNQFGKSFIKINFIWTQRHLKEVSAIGKIPSTEIPGPGICRTPENTDVKCLKENKTKCLKENKEILKTRARVSKKIKNNIPPKIEWVSQYCTERGHNIDPESFHDFYTAKDWKIGKNKMKDWQAAVRTWERNNKISYQNESNWIGKNKTIKAGSHFSGTKVKYKKSDIIIS
jgi:hypothetical protein